MENSLSRQCSTGQPTREFKTNNLYVAAWLVIRKTRCRRDRQLTFLRVQDCSASNPAKVFVFADPDGRGPSLQREFIQTNPVVRIHTLRAALNLLRHHLHGGKHLGGGR